MERTEKTTDLRREPRLRLRRLWVGMAKSWASKFRPKNQSSLIIREGGVTDVAGPRNDHAWNGNPESSQCVLFAGQGAKPFKASSHLTLKIIL